jgi:hypothetical protein
MGWKGKLVFVLIVYFAGFATAVYCLGPTPDQKGGGFGRGDSTRKAFKSEEFAKSLNSGMHKAIDLGKEAATHAAKLIREKVNEAQSKSGG